MRVVGNSLRNGSCKAGGAVLAEGVQHVCTYIGARAPCIVDKARGVIDAKCVVGLCSDRQ